MHDLRDAVRALRATPVLTLVAILSLALGIGANTAIFSLVDTLLLRSLPVREPGRLAYLENGSWTNPIWEEIRDRSSQLFAGAAAWSGTRFDLANGGEAQYVDGLYVSGGFFDVLGVPPLLGRVIGPADDVHGAANGTPAVIGYRYWQTRFGGASDVIGKPVTLSRVTFTIVGVAPAGFTGPEVGRSFDVAIPLGAASLVERTSQALDSRSRWWLQILLRLKPDQDLAAATRALRGVQPQIRTATMPPDWRPEDKARYLADSNRLSLVPGAKGSSFLRDRYERPLVTLMVVVGLVLLIACANVANLLLARATARRHELSVRVALGASRLRLARQLLAESLVLAASGAAVGLVFAIWASRLLVRQLATSRTTVFLDLALDWRVLGFTMAVAVATALLFGTLPALRASRTEPGDALKDQGRAVVGDGRRALGGPLVVAQVALSLVLVVAAGLFVRTFSGLATRHLGFESGPVMVVSLDATRAGVPEDARASFFLRITDAVRAVPGVSRAAASAVTPVSGMIWNNLFEFPNSPGLTERERIVDLNFVTPGFLATYGTPLVAGRDIQASDRAGAPPVAVVNQAFVDKYFKGAVPIGQRILPVENPGKAAVPIEIVGIAANAVYQSVREEPPPTMYQPLAQSGDYPTFAAVSLQAASGSPALLTRSVAAAIAQVSPDVSLTFRPLDDQVRASLSQERLVAMLSGFFGILALVLAAIGLYGVTSYAVSRRRTEIGIRMALGADAAGVIRLVLRRVLVLVATGVLLGAGLSLWASRFVGTLLFGLEPRDPATLAAAAMVLALIGAGAGWLPARRASRIDPAEILRQG